MPRRRRKATWALLVFNVLVLAWFVVGLVSHAIITKDSCRNVGQGATAGATMACRLNANVGTGIGVGLVVVVVGGNATLGVISFATSNRGREHVA